MSGERFTNARVHKWLTPTLDHVSEVMHATRVQLNSAALWWFCQELAPEQRAEILGEYVKVQAMGGKSKGRTSTASENSAKNASKRVGRPRSTRRG
jgi:hypothetical protein